MLRSLIRPAYRPLEGQLLSPIRLLVRVMLAGSWPVPVAITVPFSYRVTLPAVSTVTAKYCHWLSWITFEAVTLVTGELPRKMAKFRSLVVPTRVR